MNEKTLFVCRTPLQAIIINKLLESSPSNHHVIYRPNNNSKKHEYYFHQLRTDNKTLLPFQPISFSHSLSSIFEWLSLPKQVRQIKYDNLYIASLEDMVFSFFAARNKVANIYLFDDGFINLKQAEFTKWIQADSISDKIVRMIILGQKTILTHARIAHHFTIYPAELCWLDCETTELKGLFKPDEINLLSSAKGAKVMRVLLGSSYRSSEGKTVRIKHRGLIKNTIENILGGIRSTCTYIGARNLKDMPKCATFVRTTQQSNEVFGKNI